MKKLALVLAITINLVLFDSISVFGKNHLFTLSHPDIDDLDFKWEEYLDKNGGFHYKKHTYIVQDKDSTWRAMNMDNGHTKKMDE